MSEEKPTNFEDVNANQEVIVDDPKLTLWYKEGFRFALNYLHAIIPKQGEHELNQVNFKDFVNSNLLDFEIEDDYFENHKIIVNNPSYPHGLCPGPDGTCVSCPASGIRPV